MSSKTIHASDWLSLAANLIGVALGFAAFWVTFDPPRGSVRVRLLWLIGTLSIVLVACAIWQFVETIRARREANTRDRERKRQDGEMRANIERLTKRAAQQIPSIRKRARFLADQILQFVVDRHVDEPVRDFDGDDIMEPAYAARYEAFMNGYMEHYYETKRLYRDRFLDEASNVTNDLARSGIVDERLLQYVQHIEPELAEQFATRLREVAEQRD
jgi:hypothetical protein